MRRLFVAVICAATLAGCATSQMNSLVGRPLETAMARYGPPSNIFDLPDGRRAFQWQMSGAVVVPGSSSTYSTANIYAPPGAFARVNTSSFTTTTPAQSIGYSCLYTMYASWQGGGWVFVGYERPSLLCS